MPCLEELLETMQEREYRDMVTWSSLQRQNYMALQTRSSGVALPRRALKAGPRHGWRRGTDFPREECLKCMSLPPSWNGRSSTWVHDSRGRARVSPRGSQLPGAATGAVVFTREADMGRGVGGGGDSGPQRDGTPDDAYGMIWRQGHTNGEAAHENVYL